MSRRHAAAAVWCLLALTTAALPRPAAAQILGDRTEATNCASAVGSSVTNSTVSVLCGIPYEQFSQLMTLAVSGRPGDHTELLQRLDALIPASSRGRVQAIARFFAVVGEANVPPEQLETKLIEIAQRYQELLARAEATSSTDPQVRELKEQARQALAAGEFAQAEELLNQAKARDLSAIAQMQATPERLQADLDARKLSAAEAAAANGDLMMTQIRYANAARYYKEAVWLTPATYPEQLSAWLGAWAEAAWRAGDYQPGLDAARRALAMDEARLPVDAARLGLRLNMLALLYQDTGRYAAAEPLLKRAIAIDEQALGPEHPDLATGLNNLAGLYQEAGRYAEAERLYQRALAIGEQALGPEHPTLATWLNNLANLYRATGRYAAAEPLYQRAIAIGEKTLVPEHPALAIWLNNLAVLYYVTDRYAAAEPLYQRAMAIWDKSLPPDHPHQAQVRENYADLLDQLDRRDEAADLRAQAVRQRREPPSSP